MHSQAHLLIVDDLADNRTLLSRHFGRRGFKTTEAESGSSALELLARQNFDLVLLDGMMPEMDGLDVLQRIRATHSRASLPVIMVTARARSRDIVRALELGANDYICKPVDLSVALARVDAQIAQKRPEGTPAELNLDLERRVAEGTRELVRLNGVLQTQTAEARRVAAEIRHLLDQARLERAEAKVAHVEPVGAALEAALAAVSARLAADEGSPPVAVEAAPLRTAPLPGAKEPFALAEEIEQAIAREEFWVAYQPLVDRAGQSTLAVEALLRWNRAPREPLSPAVFIPEAERTRQIIRIGEWVLRCACRDALAWPGISVAVNVSPVQIQQDDFCELVERILAETGFEPHRLELELTETSILGHEEAALRAVQRLQSIGVKFALDDFGTGYSSLTYLRRFPADKIKIDRSFVSGVESSIDSATIVHAVVSIGRALGMKIVAEGVETEGEHRFLAAAGVHALQGYRFARPMPRDELSARLLAERDTAPLDRVRYE